MIQYKATHKNYKEIGQELNVAVLLEGSVQKDKNNIRVIANLIDVLDSSVLWSDSYNQKLESVFEIQGDIGAFDEAVAIQRGELPLGASKGCRGTRQPAPLAGVAARREQARQGDQNQHKT